MRYLNTLAILSNILNTGTLELKVIILHTIEDPLNGKSTNLGL